MESLGWVSLGVERPSAAGSREKGSLELFPVRVDPRTKVDGTTWNMLHTRFGIQQPLTLTFGQGTKKRSNFCHGLVVALANMKRLSFVSPALGSTHTHLRKHHDERIAPARRELHLRQDG